MALLILAGWLAFAVIIALVTRSIAVRYAKHRGWTEITMPTTYYLWFFAIYSIIVYPALWLCIHLI